MKNILYISVVISLVISTTPVAKSFGQVDSIDKSEHQQTCKDNNTLLDDLDSRTIQIILKYANIRAREKACQFIAKELVKLLCEWFDSGILNGKNMDEAFVVRVGLGKTFKENTLHDVIVVEIGVAFKHPFNIKYRRITHPLKNKIQSPESSPYLEKEFTYMDLKS